MNGFNKGLGFVVALSFAAVACAAPAIPSDTGEGEEEPETATKKPSTKAPKKPTAPSNPAPSRPAPAGPSNPPATPPGTPAPTGGNCTAETTANACFDCCAAATGGQLAKADAAYGQCACGQGGQCAAACGATACQGNPPSAACNQCLQQTCEPAADALCTTAACKAGVQCLQTSGCSAKH